MSTMKQEMKPHIINYLISCSYGCWDGSLKATSHEALVDIYTNYEGGDPDKIRFTTRKLTDHLDEEIDFPLTKAPNYNALWHKFYHMFIYYARGGE